MFIFKYYVAVAKVLDYRIRFLEIASKSLGVAAARSGPVSLRKTSRG